jgi:ribosomal protein S12 methylthiotransferase accessory factor
MPRHLPLPDLAAAAAAAAGVTRLADVTGFDIVGLPVFQAVRPRSRSLSVSQGKGRSRWVARLSALMESLELHHAETLPPGRMAPVSATDAARWQPSLRGGAGLRVGTVLPWLHGPDLLSGSLCSVPRGLVSLDLTEAEEADLGAVSTGLAGHGTREAAELKALCELLERAAAARFRALGPLQRAALAVVPAEAPGRAVQWLLGRLQRADYAVRLWDIGGEARTPIFYAVVLDLGNGPMPLPPAGGMCCHPDPSEAVFGALAEAVQGRITCLVGAREDVTAADFRDAAARSIEWLFASGAAPRAPRHRDAPAADGGRAALLADLEQAGAREIVMLTLAEGPLSFVKAIAPGLPDSEGEP